MAPRNPLPRSPIALARVQIGDHWCRWITIIPAICPANNKTGSRTRPRLSWSFHDKQCLPTIRSSAECNDLSIPYMRGTFAAIPTTMHWVKGQGSPVPQETHDRPKWFNPRKLLGVGAGRTLEMVATFLPTTSIANTASTKICWAIHQIISCSSQHPSALPAAPFAIIREGSSKVYRRRGAAQECSVS